MGIHEDHAILGLRDDEILVELGARGPKRQFGRPRLNRRLDPSRSSFCEAAKKIRIFLRIFFEENSAPRAPRAVHLINARCLGFASKSPQRFPRHRGRRPVPRLRQSMPQSRYDQPARQTRLSKTHLGLGRMHVHIHQRGIAIDEQGRRRMAIPAEHIHVSRAQGPDQQLVPHGPPVDEEILMHRRAARIGRQGGKTGQMQPLALGIDGNGVLDEIAPQDAPQPSCKRVFRRAGLGMRFEDRARRLGLVDELEPDIWLRHGQTLHHVCHGLHFAPLGAEELQPCWRRIKEIAQFDHRAPLARRGSHQPHSPARRLKHCRFCAFGPRGHAQPPHGGQRGQGLAPEPEGMDVQQVRPVDLRRGMAR